LLSHSLLPKTIPSAVSRELNAACSVTRTQSGAEGSAEKIEGDDKFTKPTSASHESQRYPRRFGQRSPTP